MSYNTHTQLADVPWSSVPGPRSIGYTHKEEEDALKTHNVLVRKMRDLGMTGAFVVTTFLDEEERRTKIT